MSTSRRRFLQSTAFGGAAVLGSGGLNLPTVSADQQQLDGKTVRLASGIEPLVRLLEETSRDELLERVAARIRDGVSYREVLAALLLAGVRNVQPRPSVGFKFHAVLVVHSAHLASISSPVADRWLPIFWALDYFKGRQLEEQQASGWRMKPVDESRVPPAPKARAAFVEAMERWDAEAADAAIAGLARTAGAQDIFELLYHYGARDYRSIGHKAIYVANSARALNCIGWQHAEPVLRSLTYALLNHTGEPNPADSDLDPDRAWRRNEKAARELAPGWRSGRTDPAVTRELVAVFRDQSEDDAADAALAAIRDGASPQSVWDAVLVGGGELLMRQPGIIGLHSMTTANALRHAFQWCGDDLTRRRIMLQACAFVPKFRESARRRGKLSDWTIDRVGEKSEAVSEEQPADEMVESIFAHVAKDRTLATTQTHAFLRQGGDPNVIINEARRLVFLKGRDAHDYKFSSAVLEDVSHLSPEWRSLFLALSTNNFRGASQRDNGLVQRIRSAIG